MRNITGIMIFIFAALASVTVTAEDQKIKYKIVTENYPPYSYLRNNRVTGCCTDIVKKILEQLKLNIPIEIMDWNQAYNLAIHEPGTIIYSITKTKERETLFKWAGPLAKNRWAFFAKAGSDIKIKNLDDAKPYKIGTYFDDVCEAFLYNENFKNIESENEDKNNIKKLVNGKIDLWITGDIQSAYLMARQVGVDPSRIKVVYIIKTQELFIGFNLETPDKLVRKFQNSLDKLKKDGVYDKIMNKYLQNKVVKEIKASSNNEVLKTLTVNKNQWQGLSKIASQKKIEMKKLLYQIFENYIENYNKEKK